METLPSSIPDNLPELPAETLTISPEDLEIAQQYLISQDAAETAESLGIPIEVVSKSLARKEVRAFVHQAFSHAGFNNQWRVRGLLDVIIKKKLKELEESDLGSNKDITEILALNHKFAMDMASMELEHRKLDIKEKELSKKNVPSNQTNVQINQSGFGHSYDSLIEKLTRGNV